MRILCRIFGHKSKHFCARCGLVSEEGKLFLEALDEYIGHELLYGKGIPFRESLGESVHIDKDLEIDTSDFYGGPILEGNVVTFTEFTWWELFKNRWKWRKIRKAFRDAYTPPDNSETVIGRTVGEGGSERTLSGKVPEDSLNINVYKHPDNCTFCFPNKKECSKE